MKLKWRASLALGLSLPVLCQAQTAAPSFPAPVMSASVIVQVFLGLALVLGLVFGAAWLMKRFNTQFVGGHGVLKVVSAAAVGQRERVVLVEIGDTWLILGVAPGQVRALHSLPKLPDLENQAKSAGIKPNFSVWLKQMIDKRQGK